MNKVQIKQFMQERGKMTFSIAEIVQAQVEAEKEIKEKHPNGRFNYIVMERLICNKNKNK
jgi:hypothetical protein